MLCNWSYIHVIVFANWAIVKYLGITHYVCNRVLFVLLVTGVSFSVQYINKINKFPHKKKKFKRKNKQPSLIPSGLPAFAMDPY